MRVDDGEGNGPQAGVTNEHRLKTEAVNVPLDHIQSHSKGMSYVAHAADTVNSLTITATGGPVLVLRNNNPGDDLIMHGLVVGIGTDAMILRLIRNPTIGTLGNEVVHIPVNTNFGSGNTALASVWSWDEVGAAAITGLTGGTLMQTLLLSKGLHFLDFNDALVLPNGSILSIECVGAGELSLAVRFFFLGKHE